MDNASDEKPIVKSVSKPKRMDYSKNATQVKEVVMHYCDRDNLPADARQIDLRYWILYKLDWSVTKHLFEVLRLIDKEGSISNYYEPLDKADKMKPFENVLPGYHVDMEIDEYRKKYIWGIKNPALKVAYYLYDNGSRSMKVAENFFKNFLGSITTDGYNVYKLFDRKGSSVTRYENLKIHFLAEEEREKERKRRSVPILSEIWQRIKVIFDETREQGTNLFIKAVRYAVNEWESVCRYVTNGKAEIDNNTAERMMKPICLGRNNYLFCGSELAAKNASLIYSIIETCKMNGIRPVKYIADVLRKLVAGETDYAALLPINIAK